MKKREQLKEAVEIIALAVGMIGLPVLMFLDWLFCGYDITPRENILTAIILIYAGWKLWK